MNHEPQSDDARQGGQGGHGKHGVLAMLACCIPMVLVFILIGLKVI